MYGKDVAEALHARLADVWAAQNVAELPLWSATKGTTRTNRFTVPVSRSIELVFESNHTADRAEVSKPSIKWEKVSRVQLLEVKQNA